MCVHHHLHHYRCTGRKNLDWTKADSSRTICWSFDANASTARFSPSTGCAKVFSSLRMIYIFRFSFFEGLPDSSIALFELENRWLRCMDHQPEPMTLLVTLFDDQEEVKRWPHPRRERQCLVFSLIHSVNVWNAHHGIKILVNFSFIIDIHCNQRLAMIYLLRTKNFLSIVTKISMTLFFNLCLNYSNIKAISI